MQLPRRLMQAFPMPQTTEALSVQANPVPMELELLRKDLECAAIHSTNIVKYLEIGNVAHALAETLTMQNDLTEMLARTNGMES